MSEGPTRRFRRPPRGAGLAALAIATLVATLPAREASADGWSPTSTTGAASPRQYHTAVWTGSKMIVWGGYSGSSLNTGGRYDPATDTWTTLTTTGAPSRRDQYTAVWTGTEMIVWGGRASSGPAAPPASSTRAALRPGDRHVDARPRRSAPAGAAGHTRRCGRARR